MPANLTPEAKAKWNEALAAKNPRDKLRAFQEFLSAIPKHKGNERLRAQIKTKIARIREELAERKGKRSGARSPWAVEREGAAQVMILGATNSGRSSLLRAVTNAQVTVAPYSYTTQRPVPGMLEHEDVQIQLVELPAPQVNQDGSFQLRPESVDLIRSADGLLILVDLTREPLKQYQRLIKALDEARILTQRQSLRVEIVRENGSGEVRVAASGGRPSCTNEQIRQLLHSYGIKNALVRTYGEVSIEDIEDAVLEDAAIYKPSIVVANKADAPLAQQIAEEFVGQIPRSMQVLAVSCLTRQGLEKLGGEIFRSLGVIRVYTKEPNMTRASDEPFVVPAGTTVRELARRIHTDLAERYRYSRIWGPTSKFAGERVGPDHVLGDRDIVEIHAST